MVEEEPGEGQRVPFAELGVEDVVVEDGVVPVEVAEVDGGEGGDEGARGEFF